MDFYIIPSSFSLSSSKSNLSKTGLGAFFNPIRQLTYRFDKSIISVALIKLKSLIQSF